MTTVEVKLDSLHRMLYNVRLFQVGKLAPSLWVKIDPQSKTVVFSINDDHTFLRDSESTVRALITDPALCFSISAEQTKHLEFYLRDYEQETVVLLFDPYKYKLLVGGYYQVPIARVEDKYYESQTLFEGNDLTDICKIAISPNRFRKLALIKPGDYPIDLKAIWNRKLDTPLLCFKAGPTVEGVLSLLDRDFLLAKPGSEHFLW